MYANYIPNAYREPEPDGPMRVNNKKSLGTVTGFLAQRTALPLAWGEHPVRLLFTLQPSL